MIRTIQEVKKERIKKISLSGDFTLYTKDCLEELEGEVRKKRWLNSKMDEFYDYDKEKVQSPGVNSEDFLKAMKVEE